jgi:hypothetical protein
MNSAALWHVQRRIRRDVSVHGLRSSFRDWVGEKTYHQNFVAEMALSHAIPSAVEEAYRRGDLFEKRRRMMADWARFCTAEPGVVVPLARRQKRTY